MNNKIEKLKDILSSLDSVLIAYSGGVDSTFLLKVAKDTLKKEKVLAVTADSPTLSGKELSSAKDMAKSLGVNHLVVKTDEFKDVDFVNNNSDRCYWCKKELFSKLNNLAEKNGLNYVVDASNFSDTSDYRPGLKAAKELQIRSPLIEASLTKKEIRKLSKKLGLPTWNIPSNACLSSRIPYGSKITIKKLRKIEAAEEALKREGFGQLRVRDYGKIARIEVLAEDLPKLLKKRVRDRITRSLKKIGYVYITADLEGYRSGSLNETMTKGRK